MTNMSYCRFENTYKDLEDCFDHLTDDDLSEDENKYRNFLIDLCQRIVDEADALEL